MTNKTDQEKLEDRRSFLKKAAYAAPAIIALGSITKPVSAAASCTAANPCTNTDTSVEVTGDESIEDNGDRIGTGRFGGN